MNPANELLIHEGLTPSFCNASRSTAKLSELSDKKYNITSMFFFSMRKGAHGLITLNTVKGPIKRGESSHESVLRGISLVASMTLSHTKYLGAFVRWQLYDLEACSRDRLASKHVLQRRPKCLAVGTSTSSS